MPQNDGFSAWHPHFFVSCEFSHPMRYNTSALLDLSILLLFSNIWNIWIVTIGQQLAQMGLKFDPPIHTSLLCVDCVIFCTLLLGSKNEQFSLSVYLLWPLGQILCCCFLRQMCLDKKEAPSFVNILLVFSALSLWRCCFLETILSL